MTEKLTKKKRLLLAELLKRKRDPVTTFKPNSVQKAWRESDVPFTMINGSNQIGGKTYVVCITISELMRGLHKLKIRNGRFLVLTPSRGQAADPFGKYLLQAATCPGPAGKHPMLANEDSKELTVMWDRTTAPPAPKYIKWKKTGNELFFFWSAFHAAQNFLEGKQFDWVFIDESAGTKALIDELIPRILMARNNNPDSGRITWTATETKVNEAHTEFLLKCKDDAIKDYQVFTVTEDVLDHGSVFDRKTVESVYSGQDETMKNIRMKGSSGAGQTVLIWPTLSSHREAYILEKPYEPTPYDNIVATFDPGMGHSGALGFCFYGPDEPMVGYWKQLFCSPGIVLPEWVEIARRYLDGRRLCAFVPDKYGGGHRDRGTGKSTIRQMMELMEDPEWWVDGKIQFRKVKQDHKLGIARVGSMLVPSGNRTNIKPLMVFDPPTPENGIGLMYRQCAAYRGREDLDFKGPHGVVKKNDEGADLLRMACQLGWKWQNFGLNKGNGVYGPESYLVKDGNVANAPEPTEEEVAKAKVMEYSKKAADRIKRRRMLKKRTYIQGPF